jgi:protein-tyrosine phosphatase
MLMQEEQQLADSKALTYVKLDGDLSWLTKALAVSRCFTSDEVADLAGVHGIAAVIDLREEDCDDEQALTRHGIAFLHLPTPDMMPADQQMLDEGVAFARNHLRAGHRLLIHCQHGIGRSALLALCVLVDLGHEPLAALRLAKDRRAAISPSHEQYLGWADWLQRHGHVAPDAHSFGCIAYRHLAKA